MIAIQTIVATDVQTFVNALFAILQLAQDISLEHATIVMKMFVQEHTVVMVCGVMNTT